MLVVLGPAAPSLGDPASPPLWVVRDADTRIYLFGSIHVLTGREIWLRGPVRRAFDSADALVLEIPPGDIERSTAALERLGSLPPGGSLAALLPPGDADTMRGRLIQAGLPADAFDRYAPWRAAMAFSVQPLAKAGYSPQQGVEAVLTRVARSERKPVTALETATFQYGRFAAIPRDQQLGMLVTALRAPERPLTTARLLTAQWARGDVPALRAAIAADLAAAPPQVTPLLVTSRNRDWSRRIAARMDRPGTLFVAVGLGHLVGPESVIERLRARGFTVERLQ